MARTTGTVRHTHQYFKRADSRWACSGKDGCTHYMPKNMSPLPVGMNSICWVCEQEFQLTPVNMENDKPTCDTCSEKLDTFNRFLEFKMPTVKKTGLEAFGAKPVQKKEKEAEKDEIEVISEDE